MKSKKISYHLHHYKFWELHLTIQDINYLFIEERFNLKEPGFTRSIIFCRNFQEEKITQYIFDFYSGIYTETNEFETLLRLELLFVSKRDWVKWYSKNKRVQIVIDKGFLGNNWGNCNFRNKIDLKTYNPTNEDFDLYVPIEIFIDGKIKQKASITVTTIGQFRKRCHQYFDNPSNLAITPRCLFVDQYDYNEIFNHIEETFNDIIFNNTKELLLILASLVKLEGFEKLVKQSASRKYKLSDYIKLPKPNEEADNILTFRKEDDKGIKISGFFYEPFVPTWLKDY